MTVPEPSKWQLRLFPVQVLPQVGRKLQHLQTACSSIRLMYNDDNGFIDGQSTVHGNPTFHREVAEALPGVAPEAKRIKVDSVPLRPLVSWLPLGALARAAPCSIF